ncbi:thioesterase II family protein [Micromonospora echinofusca]|uniref:Alpha/beta fold hydrolase n=1 Tax=Micromonospora echinofusca TaxID=47858 RepID=A0ABS3VMS0_MICEH|nr:alpha/beta fold hydrolase [Micromonospora echinofusca]MBO4205832.1 alpha/beta fold hydrolase [Micromonospora echinofusca]
MTTETKDTAWVRRFHPAPSARTRLVCFPHAGGSASYFFPVSRTLSPRFDVVALQYPGRQDRRAEPCPPTIGEMADQITEAVLPWTDLPVAFFGHSMGAILAYEVTLRLKAKRIVPTGLFASGRRAPSTVRHETNHLLPEPQFIAELHKLEGTEASLLADDDLLRMILPALRSDYRAIETYQRHDEAKVDCPIVALLGDIDPKVTAAEARVWEKHTTRSFTLRLFPGGHFYLNTHAADVIRLIADHLTAVQNAGVTTPVSAARY